MTEGISIRQATVTDAETVARFYRMAGGAMVERMWESAVGPGERPLDAGTRMMARSEQALSIANALLAVRDERAIGCIIAYPAPAVPSAVIATLPDWLRPYAVTVPDTWFIAAIAVAEACRREGTARRLMDRALAVGRKAGFEAASLSVASGNAQALGLYQSFGFETVQVLSLDDGEDGSTGERLLLMVGPTLR